MTMAEIAQQALALPERERSELANTLWASLEEPHIDATLPAWTIAVLDDRLQASASEEGEDWDTVKAEIWPESR